MGNCQTVDAAVLVIQHPTGKQEMMYWPVTAADVMKMNPGHHVSLIIPESGRENKEDRRRVRFTRVKLLRPTDTLLLGHAYRLVPTEEVVRVIRAKKCEKMLKKKNNGDESKPKNNSQHKCGKSWRPALQSISEQAGT